MENHERVRLWISQLSATISSPAHRHDCNTTNPRKRKRRQNQDGSQRCLLSPPTSTKSSPPSRHPLMADVKDTGQGDAALVHRDSTPPSPSPKRTRLDHAEADDADPTPRGPRTRPATMHMVRNDTDAPYSDSGSASSSRLTTQSDTALSYRSAYAKSGSGNKRSRQSSPRKQTMLMVMENAVEPMSFGGLVDPPPLLDALVSLVENLSKGKGILSKSVQGPLEAAREENRRRFKWVRNESFCSQDPTTTSSDSSTSSTPLIPLSRDNLGPTPSLHEATLVWSNAEDCYRFQHFESQWNCAVHHQILQIAFQASQHVGFCSVTGVQIHSDYSRGGKASHHNKKVDFCVFLKYDSPHLTLAALQSPFKSINQTDYPALLARPIAFSIETKIPGDRWAEAVNQITAWLVAQWDALDDLVHRAQGNSSSSTATDSPALSSRNPSAAAVAGLVFLPGIIVQGHEWYFIAVTRAADGRTRRWEKTLIGTTEFIEGVYIIIAVLQLLGRWAQDEYWPWFQRAVLCHTPVRD